MPDNFAVTTTKQTFRVGDSVIFTFNSGPDEITFYSGEPGKTYANKDRIQQTAGVNKLVFQSYMTQGILANPDSLRLLISTNLNGYDAVSIANASWTDITSRNSKWPTALSTSYTTSDSINISDFNNVDSINIAFRVLGKTYATSAQRKWGIQGFTLSNKLPDGTSTPLFSAPYSGAALSSVFQYTGWVQANLLPNPTTGFNAWNLGTAGISTADSVRNSQGVNIASGYPIVFDPGTAVNNSPNDSWAITKKVALKQVNPDPGVTIKNYVSAAFAGVTYNYTGIPGVYAQYLYKYTTPGVYTVTFVGRNINGDQSNYVIRQIQITITP